MGERNEMVQAGNQNLVGQEAGVRLIPKQEETNPPS